MDAALLTPSRYIKAIEFQGRDVTLTITDVKIEKLEREDKTTETKGIVSFRETQKAWVLNVTNVKCLIAMFGRETDSWVGKRVTLWPEPNSMSDSGFAIRVRGSSDIPKDLTFTLKLAKKKPRQVTLRAIRRGNAPAAGARDQGAPKSAPPAETDTGLPPARDEEEPPPLDTEDDPSLAALDPR